MVRAIRGAIDVERDDPLEITKRTQLLLKEIMAENKLTTDNIISVFFSATSDLSSLYPAQAAREMGWTEVPMMCLQEMDVQGSLPCCIRVLIHVEKDRKEKIKHIYLGKAKRLRPDWTNKL